MAEGKDAGEPGAAQEAEEMGSLLPGAIVLSNGLHRGSWETTGVGLVLGRQQ